jgi:TolB-like protein
MTRGGAFPLSCGVALVICSACGYHLSGSGSISVLPEYVKTIAIVPFENRTNRPEIEQRVTEAVTDQLSRRRRYSVTTDAATADAVLDGAILSYTTNAVQFTSEGRTSRIEAVVRVQAALRERATDELLWSQSGLIFREQFDVPDAGPFFDEETLALNDIAEGVAGVVITSIFEGF